MDDEDALAWHQALVYALTGERRPDLGRQSTPNLEAVVGLVGSSPTSAYAIPADLRAGIGPAQLAAALAELRRQLATRRTGPVVADRAPDADERRLLADVPPHH